MRQDVGLAVSPLLSKWIEVRLKCHNCRDWYQYDADDDYIEEYTDWLYEFQDHVRYCGGI